MSEQLVSDCSAVTLHVRLCLTRCAVLCSASFAKFSVSSAVLYGSVLHNLQLIAMHLIGLVSVDISVRRGLMELLAAYKVGSDNLIVDLIVWLASSAPDACPLQI